MSEESHGALRSSLSELSWVNMNQIIRLLYPILLCGELLTEIPLPVKDGDRNDMHGDVITENFSALGRKIFRRTERCLSSLWRHANK